MSRIERDIQGFDDLLPVVLKSGKRTYLRENKLGEGSFGKVLHYKIQDTSEDVAVKFIFREEGLEELKMLKKISAFDPDKNCFLKMLDHFEYESLICVVSEKLDQTFSDIILKRNQRPFDVCELRPVAQQLLVALRALKTIGLVHCDIKLNNVMFVNHQSYPYKVKLIDFGLVREKPSLRRISDIQIVGYKAPEVVFGCPLDEALDMWSVGCVLAGMYKAKHFYPRTCLYDYIASIIHMQGQPPDNILRQGKRVYEFFKHANIKTGSVYSFRKPSEYMGSPINTFRSKVTDGFFEQSFTLDDLLNQRATDINEDQSDVEEFKSLIKQMLCVDQKTRITPEEALNHNFITMKHLSERTKDPYLYISTKPSSSLPPSSLTLCQQEIHSWFSSTFLQLNISKTEFLHPLFPNPIASPSLSTTFLSFPPLGSKVWLSSSTAHFLSNLILITSPVLLSFISAIYLVSALLSLLIQLLYLFIVLSLLGSIIVIPSCLVCPIKHSKNCSFSKILQPASSPGPRYPTTSHQFFKIHTGFP
uniref:Protein kinase domain-containing protein n=1 Tax=Oryzias latipes TaxID=8090 RepID=A0A3P9LEK4_ORYLA